MKAEAASILANVENLRFVQVKMRLAAIRSPWVAGDCASQLKCLQLASRAAYVSPSCKGACARAPSVRKFGLEWGRIKKHEEPMRSVTACKIAASRPVQQWRPSASQMRRPWVYGDSQGIEQKHTKKKAGNSEPGVLPLCAMIGFHARFREHSIPFQIATTRAQPLRCEACIHVHIVPATAGRHMH